MFPINLGMVELRSAFANDMPNLRTAGFPPPPVYYSSMPGALHGSSAMGHHPESSDMSAVSVTGAGSLFTHHLNPGSLHHNHQSGDAGPFGILPHESVNLMNSTSGSTVSNHHSHPHSHPTSHSHLHSHSHGHPHSHSHSHPHGHPHASGPQNISSHVNYSNNYNNKFCSIEDNNYNHHQHHHHKSNSSCSFGGMMQAMSQNVYSGAAAAAARNTTRSSFDHQFSKQLAHAHHQHHQASDPYFNNFLMSDNYSASQYSSMNFPNSLTRDFISFGNNSHSFKHSHSNSCSNQTRVNSSITSNNHLSSCSMMMSSLTNNNYCPNANLNSPSRSSSVASSHAIHHGSESSSCSYGYSSPSSIPHSPRQKRSSVSATPAVSFQNSTVISNAPVSNGVQNYAGNSFTNTAYSNLGTPAGLSAYPTPPSSGNQQLPPQPGNTQDDSMRHFHVNSQNNGKSHQNNFNNSPYHPPKVSSGNNSSGHVISNSSCMVAAAAAAANSNVANVSVNYLQHNLKPIGNENTESCLPNLSNLPPTISDAISNSNEINKVQLNNTIDPLINNEPTLNSVFNGPEIEFPGEIEFAFNNLQSDILNGALGDQLFNTGSRHSSHSNNSDHSNSCPQMVNSNESNDILMDGPQQPQVPLPSAPSGTQPTMTTSSVSSCMVQSESVAVVNVPCVNDSIITNSCAMSDDQITIKSTTVSDSKGYQTDFMPNNQQRVTPSMTSDIGNDLNNVENKLNNEIGLIKKKKKSKESKSKIFFQQKMMQGQQSTCNKKYNSMINIVPIHTDDLNKLSNKSLLSHTTCKSVEVTSVKKSGDLKDHEAKFFKMRPTTNTTITTLNSIHDSDIKSNFKPTKKRKLEDSKDQKSILDEYEFPDSPTHPATKKVKKINLENSKKKVSEKIASNNSCSVTINKKVTLKSKTKVNQSFTGNTASSKLNISDKTEIINIISPLPSAVSQQLECNKIKIEEKVMKIPGSMDKKQFNNSNMNNSSFHQNSSNHQSQKIHKDSSKVPSIIVQEILPSSNPSSSSLSQSSNKTITNTINIVSISKKSTPGSNQSKKELSVRPCVINNPVPTNTLTTIVPIQTNTLNASIIIANPPTTSNLTSTAITQPPQTHLQPTTAIQNQHAHHASSIKNLTNQNVLMQSTATNTPRRRSQDKKALTIREGLMRTGDFVVSLDETESELPMIWRIEGKSLLQRFEPSEQDGQIVYTNTSSYSAWNPTVKQRYTGVDVRIVGCNRTKIVVEKLGLTRNNINYDKLDSERRSVNGPNIISNGEITVEKLKAPEDKTSNNFQHQADFEVFIQTLISQALDANFISEIIKENDEYFLSHIQAIDDYCIKKKSRFFTKVKWDAHIVKCVEIFSSFNVIPQSQIGDLRCRLCHDNWSTQILHFTGKMYDQVTLETKEPVDIKQTKYAACDECKEKIALFSNLHHQKYNFFTKCREKVEEVRGGVEDKDSPMILEECLKDTEWMQSLFKQFEEICQSCDRIR